MRRLIILIIFFTSLSAGISAAQISRVEPPFWWAGMKSPELQIMVYGPGIGNCIVKLDQYPDVTITKTVKSSNQNYLFIYLKIGNTAKPGTLKLRFTGEGTNILQEYKLLNREQREGAEGFDSKDVLYLIMPDRFANGDTSNDNWGEDIVDRSDSFGRHGGDFQGIQKRLDYIKNLGVTAIWLNPVLENKMPENRYKSYHGYATTDYYKVDQRFGSNEDYRNLIADIHKRGMKMVMDMIFNHCGSYHWWMKDLPDKDWLNHQEGFVPTTHNNFAIADTHAPLSEKRAMTDSWFVESMPDLNQRNPLLADYLIQNSIWWIEYARIDGIRHDTHPYVDFDFLARWCKRVESEYPHFNIVGEAWYSLPWWQHNSKVNPKETNLKTIMDFTMMLTCADAFPADTAKRFNLRKIYEVIAQDYLYNDTKNILVFLDNHDLSRFVKKDEPNLDRFKQAFGLILTTRGIPQLYYGTEILMYGEKSEGDGMLRKDYPGGWADDKIDSFKESGRTDVQNEAFNYLKSLLTWRKSNKAVTEGELIHYAPDEYNNNCYVYARIKDNSRVLVIMNGDNTPKTINPLKYREVTGSCKTGKDVTSGKIIKLDNNFLIPAKGIYILELE
jgi:glycosidase